METNVFNLKTPLDTLCYLCLLESELLSIRAFQRLGLHLDRDSFDELNFLEEATISTGIAFGSFLFVMQRGDIPPLSAVGKDLLTSLDGLGKEIDRTFWEQAVGVGKRHAEGDIAIAALEAMS